MKWKSKAHELASTPPLKGKENPYSMKNQRKAKKREEILVFAGQIVLWFSAGAVLTWLLVF